MKAKNGKLLEQTKKEMTEVFGFMPKFYSALPEPAIPAAWALQRDLELPETKLDNKTKELIGLAVASHIKCRYCIYFHTQAARAFGATEQEMREAIAMSGETVLFSNALSGAQTDFDSFRKEADKALAHLIKGAPATKSASRTQHERHA